MIIHSQDEGLSIVLAHQDPGCARNLAFGIIDLLQAECSSTQEICPHEIRPNRLYVLDLLRALVPPEEVYLSIKPKHEITNN